MTFQYIALGKPGNIEEVISAANSQGLIVNLVPTLDTYIEANGRRKIDYFIKLNIGNGGYLDSLKLDFKNFYYLKAIDVSDAIIEILENAIGIENKLKKSNVNAMINGKKSRKLRKKLEQYYNTRKESKKGDYAKPPITKTRDIKRELVDLAKKDYINYNYRLRHNVFRNAAADFYAYLRGIPHHT